MEKDFTKLAWNVDEPTYRADPALSYSTLARFNREGFENLSTLFDKLESPSLLFGSLVDTLLTDGEEEYNKKYMIAEFPDLSDAKIKIVKELFNSCGKICTHLKDVDNKAVISIADSFKFQPNWRAETRAKVIKEECSEYYDLLSVCGDRTIISTKDNLDARECVNALRNNPITRVFFTPSNDKGIEIFYQLKFKGEFHNVKLRGMLDIVIVNHHNKTIQPVDLKTSSHKEYDFPKSFVKWNYWIQAQLYAELLKQNIAKSDYYKDFKVLPYKFVVVCRESKTPLIWTYNDTFARGDTVYGNLHKIKCRGWRELATELAYYLSAKPMYPYNIKADNTIDKWLNEEF